jgi:hypothetical protein
MMVEKKSGGCGVERMGGYSFLNYSLYFIGIVIVISY